MNDLEKIRSGIQRIANRGEGLGDDAQVYIATVDEGSVDIATRICACTLVSGETDISLDTVSLMAGVNDGLLYVPADDSTVVVISSPGITPYIALYSELVQIFLVAGGATFKIYDNGLELNGSNLGGLAMIKPLTDKIIALEKLANAINDNWNNFASVYVPGSPTVTGLPAKLTTPPFTTPSDISPLTQQSDLENTTVVQGDGS